MSSGLRDGRSAHTLAGCWALTHNCASVTIDGLVISAARCIVGRVEAEAEETRAKHMGSREYTECSYEIC